MPAAVNFYIDLLRQMPVRSPTSAASAPRPDFRSPVPYTLNLYFMRRNDVTTENYVYTRFATGTPQARLRRTRPPEFCTFVLTFMGYTSPVIDARLPVESIARLIASIPSIGPGNVEVTGNIRDGFTVEFVKNQAGVYQPVLSGKIVTPSNAELSIKQITAGSVGKNAKQKIVLREAPIATATGWTEIGVPATPGWSATLDLTGVNEMYFKDGDLVLELSLQSTNVRTGTDGVTSLEGTTRGGLDGQTVGNAAENNVDFMPFVDIDGNCWLVAKDALFNGSRMWSDADVGKSVGDGGGWIRPETFITQVVSLPYYNAAKLNYPFRDGLFPLAGDPTNLCHLDIDISPTQIFKSATGAFVSTDVGHELAIANVYPPGTKVIQVIDSQTVIVSNRALVVGTALVWTLTAIPGNTFTSASALFTQADVGAQLEAPQLAGGTVISEFVNSTTVKLSQNALGAASGQSWTLRRSDSLPPPSVTSIITGNLSTFETQRIAFTRSPIGGKLLIKDSGDTTLPVAEVKCPVTPEAIQNALNSVYPNYGGVKVASSLPNGQFDVQWGVFGQQHLLTIDDSQALYDTRVATIQVGEQNERFVILPPDPLVGQNEQNQILTPNINRLQRFGLNMMGVPNVNFKTQISQEIKTRMTDGTKALQIRARFAVVLDQYTVPQRGEAWSPNNNQTFYLDTIENIEDKGGLRFYDWVGYTLPRNDLVTVTVAGQNIQVNRREKIQQMRPVYIVPKTYLNGRLVDIQLASVSVSTWAWALFQYYLVDEEDNDAIATPPSSPFGSVIHFVSVGGFTGVSMLWSGNGFDVDNGTFGQSFVQSWAMRRWKSTIWERVMFYN